MDRIIEQLCDEWKQACQGPNPISIESLLDRSNLPDRDALLYQLIRLEVTQRRSAGQTPTPAEYMDRFPQNGSTVESALASRPHTGPKTLPPVDPFRTISPGDVPSDFSGDAPARVDSDAMASAPDKLPRKSIGRYTIVATLGRGGQGDVFRGIHPTLPVEVAIKLTHETFSEASRQALREEAHILCDLDHPHIARVRDFDFDDGRPFMVLDFIRGRSLGQIAKLQPPSRQQAAELVAKLARAIGYAHARGVLHRDLKPENVVIDEAGQPKIIDFGMSRSRSGMAGAADEADEVSGTLAYMSPEQAAGITSKTDHRVDIFALGAILYRLLVGKPPYPPLSLAAMMRRVRQGDWDRDSLDAASDIPETLTAICHQAMHRDPSQRFADAEAMADALDRFSGADQSVQQSPPAPANTRTIFSCVAVVLMLLGISWITYRAGTPPTHPPPLVNSGGSTHSGSLIKRFELTHIGNSADRAEFSGSLLQFRPPRENDDIQVQAEFTEPMYCFLIAFNPDGVKQLCYPTESGIPQPAAITTLRYPPNENAAFGLTDGVGQQAFVLLASRDPLPAFDAWESELAAVAWPDPDVAGNWTYSMGELSALGSALVSTRGPVRATQTPARFKSLCDRLRLRESTDVRGVIFEVRPKL